MQKLHSGLACTLPINYSLREIPVWKLTPGMALNQRLHFNFVMQPTAGLRRALWCVNVQMVSVPRRVLIGCLPLAYALHLLTDCKGMYKGLT